MCNYFGIITIQSPNPIIKKTINRICKFSELNLIIFLNNTDRKILFDWYAYLSKYPMIHFSFGNEFKSAGYSRNKILRYVKNQSNDTYKLWFLDDDMLPSFKSIAMFTNTNKDGIYIPKRREIINTHRVSNDFFNSKYLFGHTRFRPGGSLIIINCKNILPFPEKLICEEETVWALKNHIKNGYNPILSKQYCFTHFGEKSNRKRYLRKIKTPYLLILYYIILALIRHGKIKELFFTFKQVFRFINIKN